MRNLSIYLIRYLFLFLGICGLTVSLGVQQVSAAPSLATGLSFIRLINASPYVGTVDVFLDGSKLLSSFEFGKVTDYAAIPAGKHLVQLALVGKGMNAPAITRTLAVGAGDAYTVAAIGTGPTNLSLQVFLDNNTLSPAKTTLRVYQLSPDGGSVILSSQGQTLFRGINYPNASNYLAVPSAGYTFNVFSPAQLTTVTASATLDANMIESLFIVGMFNGSPKSQLIFSQSTGFPGLPNTGSDPHAPAQTGGSFISWSFPLGFSLFLCLGIGIVLRRSLAKNKKLIQIASFLLLLSPIILTSLPA